MTAVIVRPATVHDVAAMHGLLRAFGRHWNHEDWVTSTPIALETALFGPDHKGFAHVAEHNGGVVGVALWFLTFNFWMAEPVLYLEDLYVDEAARGSGAGEALLRSLAIEAEARNCAWMEWVVLGDNSAGKRFYARHGASHQPDYELWRMERDALRNFAGTN